MFHLSSSDERIDKVMLIRSFLLFNFQGACLFRFRVTACLLYHIFSSLSRGFLNFLKFFLTTLFCDPPLFSAACPLYHISVRLSIPFSKFLSKFLHKPFVVTACRQTALILYHIDFGLSRLFQGFLKKFFEPCLCQTTFIFYHYLPKKSRLFSTK